MGQINNPAELEHTSPGLIFIEADGFSMWPFLRPGEKLIIKRVTAKALKIGDIILYRLDNQLVCHRLVKIKEDAGYLLYTRGDNSSSKSEPVKEEMLVGKAIGVLKNGKVINLEGFFWQMLNRFVAMAAPLFIPVIRKINPYRRLCLKVLRLKK